MGGKKRVSKKYIKYQYFKVRWMKKEKIMRTRNNMRSKNHTFDTIKQNMTCPCLSITMKGTFQVVGFFLCSVDIDMA